MRNSVVIGVMSFVWVILMVSIIWQETEGKWIVDDAEKIGELELARYTNQIMIVSVSGEDARLCLYEKNPSSTWDLVLQTEAYIGKNGLGKTKEGDGKTPIGVFLFIKAFGILEDPGTRFEYTQVGEYHYWIDDSLSNYYNQFVDLKETKMDWRSAEHLLEYGQSYHYVLATSYNSDGIPGHGSAVFLHCDSESGTSTAGCISVPEIYMREIMKNVDVQCVLIIDYEENILQY